MSQTVKPVPTKPTTTYETAAQPSESHAVEEADDWLDDIDAALEENELVVLRDYVQKGGE